MRKSNKLSGIAPVCIAVAAALCLQACGKQDAPPAAATTPPASASNVPAEAGGKPARNIEAEWNEKAQAYIKINNELADFNSSSNAALAQWAAEGRAKVDKGDFKAIRGGTSRFGDYFVRDIKAALAIPADTPAVDAAAKNLLETVQKYLPNWKRLEEYNTAKKFEDDNGAEGRNMLPAYKEGIEKINIAIDQFSEQVDALAREASARVMARYKASGKLLELYNMEAIAAARSVANTFTQREDFKDQAKIGKANGQLQVMENKLAEMKAEHEKRKAESPKSLPMIDQYDSIYSSLTAFAGKYRESRKEPQVFNEAVEEFNRAVESNNRMMD